MVAKEGDGRLKLSQVGGRADFSEIQSRLRRPRPEKFSYRNVAFSILGMRPDGPSSRWLQVVRAALALEGGSAVLEELFLPAVEYRWLQPQFLTQIGRASCRERV